MDKVILKRDAYMLALSEEMTYERKKSIALNWRASKQGNSTLSYGVRKLYIIRKKGCILSSCLIFKRKCILLWLANSYLTSFVHMCYTNIIFAYFPPILASSIHAGKSFNYIFQKPFLFEWIRRFSELRFGSI